MENRKRKALLILGVTAFVSIIISLFLGIIIVTVFPLLVTFSLVLIGMLCKWGIEWCIRNRERFKFRERTNKIKKKLKVDEGINAVKESYQILKEKK